MDNKTFKWGLRVVFTASIALMAAILVSNSAYPRGEYYFTGEYIEWEENGQSRGGWEQKEDLTGLNLPRWVLFVRQNDDPLIMTGILALVSSAYFLAKLARTEAYFHAKLAQTALNVAPARPWWKIW